MSILKIARMGHPVLRAKARALHPSEIRTPKIQQLVDDMFQTMKEYQGVGLAAPQVHESVRLFVAGFPPARDDRHDDDRHGNDDRHDDDGYSNDRHDDDRHGNDRHDDDRHGNDRHGHDRHGNDDGEDVPVMALINPEIEPATRETIEDWEGCLSIPDIRGRVPRARQIVVRAYDRFGKKIEIQASGFTARVIQHETDHLDGVLFFDRMRSFQSLTFLDEFGRYWSGHNVRPE